MGARSSAVPQALDRCAHALGGVADAGAARVPRLGGALQQVNASCRGFVAVSDSLPTVLASWSSSLAYQCRHVLKVSAEFAAADAKERSFVEWRRARRLTKRGELLQPLWGRGDASWEPSWDPLDRWAPLIVSESVDEFAASSELDAATAGLVSSRVAFIRTRMYSDESVDVTVGCERLVGVTPGTSAGVSITANGRTVGVSASASGLLGQVESDAMTWRFAQSADADAFKVGVQTAHRKHWNDDYGRWQALRDVGGLGMVHAYADAGFWKDGLALDPYPTSFQRSSGTQLSASASAVFLDSSGQAAIRFDQPTTIEWDFRRRRTTLRTNNGIDAGIASSAGNATAHGHTGLQRADATIFDVRGRLIGTETRITRAAVIDGANLNGPARTGSTSVTATRTDLRGRDPVRTNTSAALTPTESSDHTEGGSLSIAIAGGASSMGERTRSTSVAWDPRARTTSLPRNVAFALPAILLPLLQPPKLGKKRKSDGASGKAA